MNYLTQYPVIGALIFLIIAVCPIVAAVYQKQKKDSTSQTNSDTFVVVGRVCDKDDILMFIDALNRVQASIEFQKRVKVHHDWNGESDIYIEFCIPLSSYKKDHVYTNCESCEISTLT